MDIYNYHPVTGELLSSGQADESPLEPGHFLVPAYATTLSPPAEKRGKVRVFINGAWTHVLDHRGETWWDEDGEAITIDTIGDPAGMGLLSNAPPTPDPSTDPNDYPLTALEFDAALVRLGIDRDAVAPAIRTVFAADIDAMADSLARWWNLETMTRDNPVMGMLKPVFTVTDAQIDAAWMTTVARRS